jgi:pyruvate formate lyase activating enzyme
VRSNRDGVLYVDNYGKVAAADAVYAEELPLFHYKPDRNWLRLAGRGCTIRCPFCNTFRFSQSGGVRSIPLSPEEAVRRAKELHCGGISFGVNEPAPMHEYVVDVFRAARAAGLETHVATGGMWSGDALRELVPHLTAATVGLKGLHEKFLQDQLGADKETILANIDLLLTLGVHTELSWLVIPGLSDNVLQAQELVRFLGERHMTPPIMVMQYRPDFTCRESTTESTLEELTNFRAAFENYGGTCYVLHPDSLELNTRCRQCGRTLIRRGLERAIITSHPSGTPRNQCPACGIKVPYVV